MKVTRWPAISLFILFLVAALVIQPDSEPSSVSVLQRNQSSLVGDFSNLASTWYCVAGSVGGAGLADHEVLLGNPSASDSSVSISVIAVLAPSQQSPDSSVGSDLLQIYQLPTIQKEFLIPAKSVTSVKLSEIDGVTGEYAAALIQSNLGNLIVEHRLSGPLGAAQSSCASSTSSEWNFAAGTTRVGTQEMIFLFNPYPDSAVLDITFAADGRTRRPEAYNGLVIPPQSLLPIDVTSVVTLAETVSTHITSRSGRIVAERLVMFGDELSPNGLDTEVGSPSLNTLWVFPGSVETNAEVSVVLFNPSESLIAEIDLEIVSDVPDIGYVEPFSVTVPPASSRAVNFFVSDSQGSPSLLDASTRVAKGIPFWVVVRSTNDVPIASERTLIAISGEDVSSGFSPGVSLSGEEHFFLMKEPSGKIAVVNPASDRLTLLQLEVFSDGEIYASQTVEISAKSRKIIDLQQLGIPQNSVIKVVSSEPVSIERLVGSKTGGDWGNVLPSATSVTELFISEPKFD